MTRREDVYREKLNQRMAVFLHERGMDLGIYEDDLPPDLQEDSSDA